MSAYNDRAVLLQDSQSRHHPLPHHTLIVDVRPVEGEDVVYKHQITRVLVSRKTLF